MNRTFLFLLVAVTLLGISGGFQSSEKPDTIYFVSLNKSIQLGQYDGVVTVKELLKRGDFGIGSEEKLMSELIILDGVPYGIKADGNASVLSGHASVPFAAVKFFKADTILIVNKKLLYKEFKTFLDSVIGRNAFAAIKVTGSFASVKFRSFYKQEKPYKPTKDALAKIFEEKEVQGSLVGYYTPQSAEVLNSPNYHFHILSSDKSTGGHVLDATILSVKIEIDHSKDLSISLPDPSILENVDLNKKIL